MKVFLNKNRSKRSATTTSKVNVEMLNGKKNMPLDQIVSIVNAESIYQNERKNCSKIRLITTINPICSNVLYNKITEIVYKDGSETECYCLNMGVNDKNLYNDLLFKESLITLDSPKSDIIYGGIRDTQLSRIDDYTYHCGIDIFNNHILRATSFKGICLPKPRRNDYNFNTIDDMMRSVDGANVLGYKNDESTIKKGQPNIELHLYTSDDILSYKETLSTKLIEENGWFGFKNSSQMNVYSGMTQTNKGQFNPETTEVSICNISNVINNRSAYDFINLSPEKELFMFTPKYNKYQNRTEDNWKFYLTYPSSSTTDVPYIRQNTNSLKVVYFNDTVRNSNGTNGLKIYSITKHGLNVGDFVNVYNGDNVVLKNSTVLYVDDEYTFTCESNTTISNAMLNVNTLIWKEIFMNGYDEKIPNDLLPDGMVNNNIDEMDLQVYDYYKNPQNSEVLEKVVYSYTNDEFYMNRNGWHLNFEEKNAKILIKNVKPNKHTSLEYVEKDEWSYEFSLTNEETWLDVNVKTNTSNGNNVWEYCKILIPSMKTYNLLIQPDGMVNMDLETQDVSYKQVVNGEEVEYYVRIFSLLPNWKFVKEKPSEKSMYRENSTLISDNQIDFCKQVNTAGFAKNIYGDDITQVVFTDEIDISNLRDNLGRPLTDIYLTILKNNKGCDIWYNSDSWESDGKLKPSKAKDVEYSKVFGKLTSGFNLSPYALLLPKSDKEGHILQMNNISSYSNQLNGLMFDGDDNIDVETAKQFYGDLCCLSRIAYAEKTIDDVMFRFNTKQRELGKDYAIETFNSFSFDEIIKDDYDNYSIQSSEDLLKITTRYNVPGTDNGIPEEWRDFQPCARPEGYCYKAHYKIPIKTYSQELESQYPKTAKIEFLVGDVIDVNIKNGVISGIAKTTKVNYFEPNDTFILYDDTFDEYYTGEIIELYTTQQFGFKLNWIPNPNYQPELELPEGILPPQQPSNVTKTPAQTFMERAISEFTILRKDSTIPSYALLTKDGTCRYVWRWLLQNGEDKYRVGEEYPFTNGALYINKNINFYLKRQDPNKYVPKYTYVEFDDGPFNIEANKTTKQNDNTYKSEGEMTC